MQKTYVRRLRYCRNMRHFGRWTRLCFLIQRIPLTTFRYRPRSLANVLIPTAHRISCTIRPILHAPIGVLDNSHGLLDNKVPMLDNIAVLDTLGLSYSCNVKVDSPPVFGRFLAPARRTASGRELALSNVRFRPEGDIRVSPKRSRAALLNPLVGADH